MGWVLDHSPAKGSERLVLLSIANHAGKSPMGDAWEAWPGIDTIQREARLDRRRTAQEALARCVDNGHLERVMNGAPDDRIRGDRRPNLYRILLTNGVPCGVTPCGWCGVPSIVIPPEGDGVPDGDTTGCRIAPYGVPQDDITGCRETAPEPSLNRVEPSVEPSLLVAPPTNEPTVPTFGDFWELYPKDRRTKKGEARRAWTAAVKRTTPSDILAGLARYVDETRDWTPNDRRFIATPGPWLTKDRWEDQPGANRRNSGRATGRPIQTDRTAPSGRIDPKDL